ncbi:MULTISPECIES: 2-oxoglutarate dehydrogenase complex dihydrolipoyllysine-residue succinyltransferase [Marichromatium]|uniref:Dihydrolipoyllysine-residue succinyltransferase component of 2-oxoglutarate dehydrogenase complex n=1 Tax=Marichromatium gracile TaxID=1048 RepID=A0A4R4AGU6_MARGR|nr:MULTISPECIES: 2-oxoglutarate dehydrogenase complex dihydrolipoyllysine-residue succinyltransferase [Marichromatium]MBK1708369.1 dihydrolipoyllysine-residue succinyltransferase [Marichromatium gracile]RNE89530.1 2-oxoglutarate dehydrogenase complex dihydrolipoyllysine-residue succinyltransferase [Marichromatium sp. AB31]TCW38502.1 2-oxoglutarate dehydrogenase E2 component [Marichromatium gracile]
MSEVRVPALPESVADATVLTWHKQPGERVSRAETLVDLETDKVVLEVPAPADGVLGEIKAKEGELVTFDTVLAVITEGAAPSAPAAPKTAPAKSAPAAPAAATPAPAPTRQTPPAAAPEPAPAHEPIITPAARRLVKEMAIDPSQIHGSGKDGRVQKADVIAFLDERERQAPEATDEHLLEQQAPASPSLTGEAGRPEQRVPMTRLRARIAERLLEAQRNAAMLTTFNEVNLSALMTLRGRYKDRFEQQHGVRLGLMSFFVKATVEALKRYPVLNATVDGEDILYHGYYDIGIAVSSPRGLVVPILRNCDQLTMADIEGGIAEFATKAQDGSLSYEELTGGTFSITNGGVFGSMLSTPILNPPQSGILGMHKIQERPVVENGEIVVAPMMYLALTYDHRIIDGREAVQFLVAIKELLEDPALLLLGV